MTTFLCGDHAELTFHQVRLVISSCNQHRRHVEQIETHLRQLHGISSLAPKSGKYVSLLTPKCLQIVAFSRASPVPYKPTVFSSVHVHNLYLS